MSKSIPVQSILKIVGEENVISSKAHLISYALDFRLRRLITMIKKFKLENFLPELVVMPENTEQVSEIMKIAYENEIPVIPRGAGTSLSGQLIPVKGGIILDFRKMNRILELNLRARHTVLEPGVYYKKLNKILAEKGFWFPPDPGSAELCTIGGMVANNASGLRACKYGTTKDYVLGLEVVLSDGKIIKTGSKAQKTSSGLNITDLFVGSEGCLGIITKIILRTVPKPPHEITGAASFKQFETALETAYKVLESGLTPASMEFLDILTVSAMNVYLPKKLKIPFAKGTLLIRTDGTLQQAEEEMKQILKICEEAGGQTKIFSSKGAEELWNVRAALFQLAERALQTPESPKMSSDRIMDIAVPLDQIPELLSKTRQIAQSYGFTFGSSGHIGDGNVHMRFMFNMDENGIKRADECEKKIINLALELGGTITAEHGIGLWKSSILEMEHRNAIEVMRQIKKALDPKGILNPGKMALDFIPDIAFLERWL